MIVIAKSDADSAGHCARPNGVSLQLARTARTVATVITTNIAIDVPIDAATLSAAAAEIHALE